MTPETTAFERRRVIRRRVHLPMVIGGVLTRTIDMSTSGIRFAAVSPLAAGTPITFSLLVPGAADDLSVACEGRVVRVERHGEASHVAATIESMSFEQSDEKKGKGRNN